jgi:beta-phosphoglucomutase-like phosphatase (HAD superfamily)
MSALPTSLQRHPAVDAVIWDYDGTLVDTRFADEAAVTELIRRDPSAAAGAEVFWATEGQPIIQRLELAWPGRAREVLPLFDQPVPPHRQRGVGPVLDTLRRGRVPMAVVSSRRRDPLDWGLRAARLRPYFATVIGLEDVGAPKPDPEGLLVAARRLSVSPSRAVYVGDSEVDVEAGHRAGMTAWRAAWAAPPPRHHAHAPFLLLHPSEVVERLEDLGTAAG